jgi:STE24 endopeptidase
MHHPETGHLEGGFAKLPTGSPPGYTAAENIRAQALDQALFFGDLASVITTALALCTVLASGLPERVGALAAPRSRAWIVRIVFLVAVFLGLKLLGMPYLYSRFTYGRSLGLNALTTSEWLRLSLLGIAVPLTVFVFKYVMLICMLALSRRWWWLAAALGFFLVGLAPELISRTYPLDPVEQLRPLPPGEHFEALKAVLDKAGLNLPLMIVDESRRSKTANICLTGQPGREYVLLTDTFVTKYAPSEAALAFAHELGHFQHRMAARLLRHLMSLLSLALGFGLAFLLVRRQDLPVTAAPRVILFTMLSLLLLGRFLGPISLAIGRWDERLADRYALQLGADPRQFNGLLLKVARQELEPLDMPGWRYYLWADHPTILERMAEAANGRLLRNRK